MDYENLGPAMAQSGLEDRIKRLEARIEELEKLVKEQTGVIRLNLLALENHNESLQNIVNAIKSVF